MQDIQKVIFEDSKNQWQKLEKISGTITLFQTYDFHRIWLNHFGKNVELHILQITNGEEVIGFAPLLNIGSTLQFIITQKVLGGELVSDYGDIIFQQGKEQIVWDAVIAYAKENNYGLKLDFIRESSPSYNILTSLVPPFQEYCAHLKGGTRWMQTDVALYLTLPKTWDDYLARLPRHDRQELRRKMKKLTDVRLAYVEPTGENLSTLFDLMRQSGEDKVRFLKPEMEAFFTELSHAEFISASNKTPEINSGQALKQVQGDNRISRLVFLYQNNTPIAAVVGFIFGNRWYLYNSGYRADLKNLSAGVVLKGLLIKDAIEKGVEVFDFLRGGERYKYNLGGVEEKLYTITMSNFK